MSELHIVTVKESSDAELTATALGNWDALQKQPSATLPELLDRRATQMAVQSRFQEAAQSATRLREIDTATAQQWYSAAKVLCRCAKSITDAELPLRPDRTAPISNFKIIELE